MNVKTFAQFILLGDPSFVFSKPPPAADDPALYRAPSSDPVARTLRRAALQRKGLAIAKAVPYLERVTRSVSSDARASIEKALPELVGRMEQMVAFSVTGGPLYRMVGKGSRPNADVEVVVAKILPSDASETPAKQGGNRLVRNSMLVARLVGGRVMKVTRYQEKHHGSTDAHDYR